MEDTSLPAAAVSGEGTQGLLFPFRSLSPRRSLVFPQQTVGHNEGGVLPSPRAKGVVSTGPIGPLNGRIGLPMKIKSMTCFFLALLLAKWLTAITSISKINK